MNRRITTLLLALLVFLCAVLYGCRKKEEETPTESTETAAATTQAAEIPETTGDISAYFPEGQTEVTQPETTAPRQEATEATIPPENVEIGVIEGAGDSSIDVGDGPHQTQPPQTQPVETKPPVAETLPQDFDFSTLTYESYNAMTGEQQKAIIDMFASPEEFMRWYQRAEEKYKEEHPDIEIGGDGNVNLG